MAQDVTRLYSAKVLHRQLKIPRKYLQGLLTDLTKRGLIRSVRGRNGGYIFARSIKKITLAQVIDAVDGFKATPSCFFGFEKCPLNNLCAMHHVWASTQEELIATLAKTRLSDLLTKQ
jgi:Rrf2 family protein